MRFSPVDALFISTDFSRDHLHYVSPFDDVIIAVEEVSLRHDVIKRIKHVKKRYIILLSEIELGCHVKINNIIYSSLHFSLKSLQHLVKFNHTLAENNFTQREYDVLKLAHLRNCKIAEKLNLSQKTTSTYRTKIQEKLSMRAKNALAMHRIKAAIIN